ncbi:phosphatase PAP2 family protein [Aquimarina sp. U1-2]|uniref:phosphatase PAP2 family protein n=1 Tax=Aquimarina sp. U1-2 TaxID=2823141 RepID=UPI001AEC93C2|nr:phosphatase PAP2 family protein [Aquimarina sp. U1-2]MBP2831703.1 phosphatase PAP2 family protein [Aquimarina sp. U1-2]
MNYLKYLLLSTLLVVISNTSYAQDARIATDSTTTENTLNQSDSRKKMTTWQTIKYDGASIYGGVKNAYTQPFRWKGKNWLTFGSIMAGTAILLTVDEPTSEYFADRADDIPQFVRQASFRFGKPLFNYGLTTSVYALGLITKNEKIRKTGVLLIASATAGGLLQTVSKTLVGRARPLTDKGNLHFKFYSGGDAAFHSFPSGHAILSITTAYAIGKQFKNPFIKGGIYALGMLSPVSRLWEEAHWLTDVVLSTALSIAIVDGVEKYLEKKERYAYKDRKHKINWNLRLGAGQIGVVGQF